MEGNGGAHASEGMSKKEWLEQKLKGRQAFATGSIGTSLHRGQQQEEKKKHAKQPYRDPTTDPLRTPLYNFQISEVYEHDIPNMRASTVPGMARTPVPDVPVSRKVRPPNIEKPDAAQTLPGFPVGTMTAPRTEANALMTTRDPDEVLMTSIQVAAYRRQKTEKGASIAPDDVQDIIQLSTAEDVIAFFSKAGNTSAVKFVYLNRAAQGLLFRPYDLKVVLRGKQEPEHFCISASGCVHVKPGHPSEVVSLSDWMRESTLFNVLTRVRFFKNYLVGKAFTQWRRNIRFRLYCQTRKRLCRNFFLSKQTFAGTLSEMHKTAFDLSTVSLVYYPEIKEVYTHDKFKEEQAALCRTPAEQEFRAVMDNMEHRLLKLCEGVTQRANVPDLTTQESLEQYLLANAMVNGKEKGKGGKRMKSMVDAQNEQQDRMRMLKRAMAEHSMLDPFIRLVDYIAAENLFKNALSAVHKFHKVLNLADSEKIIMFQITISFQGEEDLVFVPSEREILDTYGLVLDELIHLVGQVTRLIYIRDVKIHFAAPPKTFSVGTAIRNDFRHNLMKRETCQLISTDFAAAFEQAKLYESYRKWFIFVDVDWKEVEARWEAEPEELTPEEFEKYIHDPKQQSVKDHKDPSQANKPMGKVKQALSELDALFNRPQGMLLVNSNKLRTTLQEKLDDIMTKVRKKLLEVAKKRTTDLIGDIQNKMRQLVARPNTLQPFAAFVQSLNEIRDESQTVMARCDDIQRLYEIADMNGIKPTLDEQGRKDLLLGGPNVHTVPLRDQFVEYIQQAGDYKINNLKGMSSNLENYIDIANEELLATMAILDHGDYVSSHAETRDVLAQLAGVDDTIKSIEQKVKMYTEYQRLFDTTPSEWTNLNAIKDTFKKRHDLWSTYDEFMDQRHTWESREVRDVDESQLNDQIKGFNVKAQTLHREIGDEVSELLVESVTEEMRNLPVMLDLCNKDMLPEHWEEIFRGMGKTYGPEKDHFTLSSLRAYKVFDHREMVGEVSGKAKGQAGVRKCIGEIKEAWDQLEFTTKQHRDAKDVFILGDLTEIMEKLEEHQLTIQTQQASRYASGDDVSARNIRKLVEDWDRNLATVSDVLDEWVALQQSWMYLEFIFSSDDIKQQLQEESKMFSQVDKDYKELVNRARTKKNAIVVCNEPGTLNMLKEDNRILDEVQKKLEQYLATKRAAFPRFYFLSNDELLEILSDVRNPHKVQPHLGKCFDNMKRIVFNNEDASEVSAMSSNEGEEVKFAEIVETKGNVEVWLGKIEAMMKESLLLHMGRCHQGYYKWPRGEWYFQFPAQCILCVDMIVWTFEVEEAILKLKDEPSALKTYLDAYNKQIKSTVEVVKQDLDTLKRQIVNTIIVMDVHNRDMIKHIIAEDVQRATDFAWSMQLRYYWTDDNVSLWHCQSKFTYGYEYLGNQMRLVITPLTDRAFLTCTGALSMNLGAAPQGPAGTGKTESVKDLGKGLARQVVVFNCSDGINVSTMAQFFAGLAQAGAWACFDEFNRIDLEVLSVVAMQMLTITTNLAQKHATCEFEGQTIKLNPGFGVYITMNPGYAGRTELPDNLKTLFRPICMMIPDYRLIAQIMFYSEGFTEAESLAQKMVQLYKLSSEQLSKQYHYDFGMRAVKSILVMAGQLKRGSPDDDEEMLLIRAMRDSNIPKFLRDDTVLFQALIKDLFPTVQIETVPNDLLEDYVKKDMLDNGLQIVDSFTTKIVQCYDTMVVRHGMMTVGLTQTGKTTCMESLKRSLTKMNADGHDPDDKNPLFNTVHTHWVNPKSITSDELYGEVNSVTREWSDGVLSHLAKQVAREGNDGIPDRNWLIFDGPVDAVWIENLNTVLDDNRMLCLVSGERIKIPTQVLFVFEVQDLAVASPATVSRCGMVYLEPFYLESTGWPPIARTFNAKLQSKYPDKWRGDRVTELIALTMNRVLSILRESCKEWIASVDQQLVVSMLHLIEAYLVNHDVDDDEAPTTSQETTNEEEQPDQQPDPEGDGEEGEAKEEAAGDVNPYAPRRVDVTPTDTKDPKYLERIFDMYFVMAVIWSIGGNVSDSTRAVFSDRARPILTEICPQLPQDGSIYDFCIHKKSASFVPWEHKVPEFLYNRSASFFDLFVPTSDTVCMRVHQRLLTSVGRHILLNGVTGVGKSAITSDFISSDLNADNPQAAWASFACVLSAQTSSKNLQERMETKLHKKKNNLFGASPGKRLIFFVDDINMPKPEIYGASPPLELLRQVIAHGGFYDRKKVSLFKHIEDLVIVAACGPPGGGKNSMTQRLTSRFHMLCTPSLSVVSMKKIFFSILRGFLSVFDADVRGLCGPIIDATLECYDRIAKELKPTPAKSHYTFNLRDLSKVIQGVLQVDAGAVSSRATLLRLWTHEASRVFHDRLVDETDKSWWWRLSEELFRKMFNESWVPAYKDVLFGDYMQRIDKKYAEIEDLQKYHDMVVHDYQLDYNIQEGSERDLVFFKDALHHLSRICRVIRQPRGNALLVGVGGSGRQSLASLATFMCNMKRFSITITRNYGMNEFHEDLRTAMLASACDDQNSVFLMTDSQILHEQQLEDVNNILNTGEVPNLLQPEDIDRILKECRKYAKAAGKQETRNVIIAHFTSMVRQNLKVVFTMSPIGDAFRNRLRMFPSLVNCMTIDWYTKWPSDALLSVAEKAFAQASLGDDTVKKAVCEMCVEIHSSVSEASEEFYDALRRRNYTTPTSYLSLISSYQDMLANQTKLVAGNMARFQGGLDKLSNTTNEVDEMKDLLTKKQPELVKAQKDTDTMMAEIEVEQKDADVIRADCQKEEADTSVKAAEAQGISDECQEQVDKAMPAFHSALAALDSLSKDDITLLKTMGSPPERVKLVLEAVLLLLGEKNLSWETAKKYLSKMDFMKQLKDVDAESIPDGTIKKMNKNYMNNSEFEPEVVKSSSLACMSLCMWARAVVSFNQVTKNMAPLKKRLEVAKGSLKEAEEKLKAARARLTDVENKVAKLRANMQGAIDRKKMLETDVAITEARLVRADKLISGLSNEKGRWLEQLAQLKEENKTVVGTMLLAAGSVAYTGPFTAQFRSELIGRWTKSMADKSIPVSTSFKFDSIADPVRVRTWGIKGLPLDTFSIENATIVERSHRWCLCIDPQGQANSWIKAMERDTGLMVLKQTENKFMQKLETCIRSGTPVLLENVGEQLDASLDPVLLRQTVKKGGRLFMKLGDGEVEYEPTFKFYITTKMPNPHYMPELQIKVTIINFTVTQKGLEDQLLADVVRYEKAELEEQLDKVVVQIADGKSQLKDIEDRILSQLADATGNILDNEALINTLGESKVTSEAISVDVRKGETAKAEIAATRERYRPVATRGSLLYSVISEIQGMDHMYQYSLDFFKGQFQLTLQKAEKADDIEARTAILIGATTENTYNTICRGLFEQDKQLFAFLMVSQIFRACGDISNDEWLFMLRGAAGLRPQEPVPKPDFLQTSNWDEIQVLAEQPAFSALATHIADNHDAWKDWVAADEPHLLPLPGDFEALTQMQKLLVLRCLREDKVMYGITQVVGAYLGKMFTESPQFDLAASFEDSTNVSPVIFVLTEGTDPTTVFYEFAGQKGWGNRLLVRSLGQDQGTFAQQYIQEGMRSGDWVYLQNCHVYGSWMPTLEKLCEELLMKEVHPDFRLWLTSRPEKKFPVSILQNGIKITKEPPQGLKANLRDSFAGAISDEMWADGVSKNKDVWRRLLFALTFFHGIIQERRKYGALGWNIRYAWNQSDLAASVVTLKDYLEAADAEDLPFDALTYLTGVINYGGRVTDFLDTRCLRYTLAKFFVPDAVRGKFDITPDGVYSIPEEVSELEGCRSYLSDLPPYEKPEVFGLHGNADITREKNESQRMILTLVDVQPRAGSGGGGRSADDMALEIAQDFLDRLPQTIDKSAASDETYNITEAGDMISLGTFLIQEIDVFNFLLGVMKKSLIDLMAAIKGEVVMSQQLERMFNDFLINKVPENWGGMKLSYLSKKPLAPWYLDTCNRVLFLKEWNDNGPPTSFWVPGFYFPQGFLTAVLQTHSRRFRIPIDELKFRTHVMDFTDADSVPEEPPAGVYTYGFFLEGCRWDSNEKTLVESQKGTLYTQFPVIWLEPILVTESTGDPSSTYESPLYKTTTRAGTLSTTGLSTNLVTTLHLPSTVTRPDHWIMRSVALLCMLDN
ncbi:Dynein-1-beta heavy chain [Diplonema papillatum]|nr:Dynein-1-beta heavy chain [Diplonema papillatum]